MKTIQRMLSATAAVIFCFTLYACGGGTSIADSTLSQAQFDSLLKSSALYKTLTTSLSADENALAQVPDLKSTIDSQAATIASLQSSQASDEKALVKVEAFGHSRSAVASASSVRTLAIDIGGGPRAQVITYGPCADMGQSYGNASPDPTSTTVKYYRQCPINGVQYVYGAVVQTGAIAQPALLWFDQPACGGNPLIFQNDGAYNRSTLQGGVVFDSPVDGTTELAIIAGQAGDIMTSHSVYDLNSRTCITVDETHPGYLATPNDVNVTGVPAAVPADFID